MWSISILGVCIFVICVGSSVETQLVVRSTHVNRVRVGHNIVERIDNDSCAVSFASSMCG